MDRGAVLTATCLASALATLLMALLANYPIARRAGDGTQLLLRVHRRRRRRARPGPSRSARSRSPGASSSLTAGIGLRERVITAVPDSLKHAISVGIGLLIALIGLEWSGIIVARAGHAGHARRG